MSDYFTVAGEIETPHHKILIIGDSGDGKTFTGSMAAADVGKDPMVDEMVGDSSVAVLLTEHQGVQSIRSANPKALIKVAEDMNDVREFIGMAADGVFAKQGITRLLIDGLTEIQQMLRDDIIEENDGDEDFHLQDWGSLSIRSRKLFRTIRALPYDIIATALVVETVDERKKETIVSPMFEGRKTTKIVAQFFTAVGVMSRAKARKRGGKAVFTYRTLFEAPKRYRSVKGVAPLVGAQPACAGLWLDILNRKTDSQQLEDVVDPHEEREERERKEKEDTTKRRGRRKRTDKNDDE